MDKFTSKLPKFPKLTKVLKIVEAVAILCKTIIIRVSIAYFKD